MHRFRCSARGIAGRLSPGPGGSRPSGGVKRPVARQADRLTTDHTSVATRVPPAQTSKWSQLAIRKQTTLKGLHRNFGFPEGPFPPLESNNLVLEVRRREGMVRKLLLLLLLLSASFAMQGEGEWRHYHSVCGPSCSVGVAGVAAESSSPPNPPLAIHPLQSTVLETEGTTHRLGAPASLHPAPGRKAYRHARRPVRSFPRAC